MEHVYPPLNVYAQFIVECIWIYQRIQVASGIHDYSYDVMRQ